MSTVSSAAESANLAGTNTKRAPFRFSGHESFACRFAWLPKACALIERTPSLLMNDEATMVELGIGKNMVRSLRFWVEAMGVASRLNSGYELTQMGVSIFGQSGLDPYIEHPATPWLLHWKLSSRQNGSLFAWHLMFNMWPFPEFSRTDVLAAMKREASNLGYAHSEVTLSQHLDVFLHSYLSSRADSGIEDSLDGPLTELALLSIAGERPVVGGRRELIYTFNRNRKQRLGLDLITYITYDYWDARWPGETTITLREIAHGEGSPGRILRLSELELRDALDKIAARPNPPITIGSSAVQYLLIRSDNRKRNLLERVYGSGNDCD